MNADLKDFIRRALEKQANPVRMDLGGVAGRGRVRVAARSLIRSPRLSERRASKKPNAQSRPMGTPAFLAAVQGALGRCATQARAETESAAARGVAVIGIGSPQYGSANDVARKDKLSDGYRFAGELRGYRGDGCCGRRDTARAGRRLNRGVVLYTFWCDE